MARMRYITTARMVATLLREHCVRRDGTVSNLYWYVLCLCIPFFSFKWYEERLRAYIIANCTQSRQQIASVVKLFTGATITFSDISQSSFVTIDGTKSLILVAIDSSEDAQLYHSGIPFSGTPNQSVITVTNWANNRQEVESLLMLLIPFYVNLQIIWA